MKGVMRKLKRAGACVYLLSWSEKYDNVMMWRRDLREHSDWYLWVAGQTDLLVNEPPEILDACAERAPWMALEYAATLLSPTRLDACKKETE